MNNYPPGVTDNDPYFTDESPIEDDEEPEEGYHCPWCMKDHQTTEHIRKCSGFQASGMPDNETSHRYGCACPDCMDEYRKLKR